MHLVVYYEKRRKQAHLTFVERKNYAEHLNDNINRSSWLLLWSLMTLCGRVNWHYETDNVYCGMKLWRHAISRIK